MRSVDSISVSAGQKKRITVRLNSRSTVISKFNFSESRNGCTMQFVINNSVALSQSRYQVLSRGFCTSGARFRMKLSLPKKRRGIGISYSNRAETLSGNLLIGTSGKVKPVRMVRSEERRVGK